MRVVQLLSWKLKSIESILDEIKKQGFDAIQINPMQQFKEMEDNFHWWLSYQPLGFNLGNRFGTKEDLTSLCQKAKEKGIDIIVDLVCNHVANKNDQECMTPSPQVDPELLNHPECFKPQIAISDYNSRFQTVNQNINLPGMYLDNPMVQRKIFAYLDELNACGVNGLRIDAAKHVGFPNDGVMFFQILKKYLKANKMYAYGEMLGQDVPWMDEASEYFDILNHYSCGFNNPKKMMTFVESHDTYLNENGYTQKVDDSQINKMYCDLLAQYPNALKYVRAVASPYNDFHKSKHIFNKPFDEIDEFDYFDLSFLEDENIKIANEEAHEKHLVLR